MALVLRRARRLHHRARRARDARHRRGAAAEVRRGGLSRRLSPRDGGAQMGRPRHGADHHRARRQGRRRPTRAPRCGASPRPRSTRRPMPISTAISAPCSTRPGRRCTGAPRARWSSTRCCSSPRRKPFEPLEQDRQSHVRLHVRRMFITDAADLLPSWLRFVQGVVDTEDLPLNVSREMLQSTPVLARIRKAVTNRVLTELKTRAKDAEDYGKFWDNFGAVLKEGVWEDPEHRTDIAAAAALRAPPRSRARPRCADYVGAHEGRAGGDLRAGRRQRRGAAHVRRSSKASAPAASRCCCSADPIDAFWPERLAGFEGKPIRSVTPGRGRSGEVRAAGEAAAAPDVDGAAGGAESRARRRGGRGARDRPAGRERRGAVGAAAGRICRCSGCCAAPAAPASPPPPVLEINPRHALIATLAGASRGGRRPRRGRGPAARSGAACRTAICRAIRPRSRGASSGRWREPAARLSIRHLSLGRVPERLQHLLAQRRA